MSRVNLSKRIEINPRTPTIQAALEYAAESVHGEEVHLLRAVK